MRNDWQLVTIWTVFGVWQIQQVERTRAEDVADTKKSQWEGNNHKCTECALHAHAIVLSAGV